MCPQWCKVRFLITRLDDNCRGVRQRSLSKPTFQKPASGPQLTTLSRLLHRPLARGRRLAAFRFAIYNALLCYFWQGITCGANRLSGWRLPALPARNAIQHLTTATKH